MKELFQKIKDTWKVLDTSIYTGKNLENNLRVLTLVSIFTTVLSLFLLVLDIITKQTGMVVAAFVTFLFSVACVYEAGKVKNRDRAIILPTIFCIVVFTVYTLAGTGDGAAMLWTLLLPVGISYFVSVKYGIILSAYYSIFFAILFYTPIGRDMDKYYNHMFIARFPIVYASVAVFTSIAMVQYHLASLKAQNYEIDLRKEVEELTRKERQRREEVEAMSLHTVQTLANAIDAKDRYTKGHSYRVSRYSAILAKELGMSAHEIDVLRLEALLHDIGKIGVPDAILNKPGKLSDIEFHIIKSHTELGASILKNIETLSGAREVALCHHERYNGSGYPNGLSGDAIPLHARIVGIADAYDAMHSTRIYRPALTDDKIRAELLGGRGTQFDPQFLDVFLKLLDEGRMVASSQEEKVRLTDYEAVPLETLAKEVQEVVEKLPDFSNETSEVRYAMNVSEFMKTYDYVEAMAFRYKMNFEMVMITVTPKEDASVSAERLKSATASMELAIRRNARDVDACAQCSDTQIIAVFLGTDLPNVDKIMERIIAFYYKIFDGSDFSIKWERAEKISSEDDLKGGNK